METPGKDLRSRLRRFGKLATAGIFAAAVCSFSAGVALADHHHDFHGHYEHHWHGHGWHEGPAIVYGGPDYYYSPPPDYYYAPEPYGYYGPPEYGPEYYPRSEGLNLFFHVR
jgi:hypothetical protein